ncbi:MAG TPA: lactate racemase domain-containing protein [Clostridia bacterium]|nr:lactate racemase domain-containing protein [Clostridia bacterium]
MENIILRNRDGRPVDVRQVEETVEKALSGRKLGKVLLIPPDFTRFHSMAGLITGLFYKKLKDQCEVDILPALGTHEPMTREECFEMFGDIPFDRFIVHDWRNDVEKIGEVPASFVSEVSEGLVAESIPVEVNRLLLDESYDLIVSIGQVVPHEVVGMANYSKNIFVGCGGRQMINSSHMLGAFYGMERIMGRDFSPVRKVFDYAEENFIKHIPLIYFLTVTTAAGNDVDIHGLFVGRDRRVFEEAVALSQQVNLNYLEEAPKKMVVFLNEKEFKSTWLGNKSVYRTRMAIADGGELVVLAPGVQRFGEDDGIDRLIRRYGYVGREKVLELVEEGSDLKGNLSAAAHLIHGSSDGRFTITYAVSKISQEEIEGVNYRYASYEDMAGIYNPDVMKDGWNTVNGERIYYISNPALGLWAERKRFE